jgi:hypothetical protein
MGGIIEQIESKRRNKDTNKESEDSQFLFQEHLLRAIVKHRSSLEI